MNSLSDKVAQRAEYIVKPQEDKPVKAASISDLIKVMEPEIKKALPSVMTPEPWVKEAGH